MPILITTAHPINPMFHTIAHDIGKCVAEMNAPLNRQKPHQDRGAKNQKVAALGALGEMIVHEYLTQQYDPSEYQAGHIIALRPQCKPDFRILDKLVDVKTTPVQHSKFLVNRQAHHNEKKRPTHYWFVNLLGELFADIYEAPYTEITEWTVEDFGYGDGAEAYTYPIPASPAPLPF